MPKRLRAVPQQDRAHDMRRLLLTSTLDLLSESTKRPTTQAIADRASVSIGTVYRYFASLEEILGVLRHEAVTDVTTTVASAIGSALDSPPEVAVRGVVAELVAAFEKHAPLMRVTMAADGGEYGAAWAEIEAPLLPLGRLLPARMRPDLDEAAREDLVFLTMGATASLCLRIALLRPPSSDRERLVDTAAAMLLAAFVA